MKTALVILATLALSACSIVGPGQRGVRVSLGTITEEPKNPGIYLWFPIVLGMTKVNVQIQKAQVETTAASKDMQDVHTVLAVNWAMDPKNVVETYKAIGDEDDVEVRILVPAVNEVMKAATAKRTAEEVLTKRLELKKDIDEGLKERLTRHGLAFYDVSIVNVHFSKEFSQAIEEKQIAEQSAKKAEYVALEATQSAKAEVERAKGQATAQTLLRSSLTNEILQQRAIEKWDGKFPQFMGQNSLPFISTTLKQ